jgi:hypothetical protein
MTTEIFFQNLTPQNFQLMDIDNNNFGQILAGQSYSLKLNFSGTFEKQYNLIFSQGSMTFFLNINAEINRVNNNNQPYTLIAEFENFRVPIFNKLIIAPIGGVFLRGSSSLNLIMSPPPPPGPMFFELSHLAGLDI